MPANDRKLPTAATKAGVVLMPTTPQPRHEQQSHAVLATLLAELIGCRFIGSREANAPAPSTPQDLYFVPSDTLLGDAPRVLGIAGPQDLFGGAVSHPFMATKSISHAVISDDATVPPAWSYQFGEQTAEAVLRGFTVFSIEDAREAGRRLLKEGPFRVKPVQAKAGRGQVVMRDASALESYLATLNAEELATWGLVLEENLENVTTYSVGQVHLGGLVASYYGTQRLARDHGGESVYGGSDLKLYRGGYESLLDAAPTDELQRAVAKARVYDAAARSCYPTLIASRLNYDVVQGTDASGKLRYGVLEHSWRIGGASGAEILALRAFADDNALQHAHAWTRETYGVAEYDDDPAVNTIVMFKGLDDDVGYITKTASIRTDGLP